MILDDIPAGEQRITLSADGYRSITIDRTEVLDFPFSDHLPVAVELTLPSAVRLPVTATGLH